MLEPGSSAYPPDRPAWQFPPPPVQKRWKWIAVTASVAGLAAAVAMLTFVIVVGDEDFSGVIDDEGLTATIAAECERMRRTVESMPLAGTPEGRAATVVDQNRAIELMVESIRARRATEIRDDEPAEEWLQDWELLVLTREAYAEELLRDPNASLELPVDASGDDITVRMGDAFAGESVCEVPDVLVSPGRDSRSAV